MMHALKLSLIRLRAMLGKEFLSNNIFELEKDLVVFKTSDIEFHSLRQVPGEESGQLSEEQKSAHHPAVH